MGVESAGEVGRVEGTPAPPAAPPGPGPAGSCKVGTSTGVGTTNGERKNGATVGCPTVGTPRNGSPLPGGTVGFRDGGVAPERGTVGGTTGVSTCARPATGASSAVASVAIPTRIRTIARLRGPFSSVRIRPAPVIRSGCRSRPLSCPRIMPGERPLAGCLRLPKGEPSRSDPELRRGVVCSPMCNSVQRYWYSEPSHTGTGTAQRWADTTALGIANDTERSPLRGANKSPRPHRERGLG
jgi:hypothetical protein